MFSGQVPGIVDEMMKLSGRLCDDTYHGRALSFSTPLPME